MTKHILLIFILFLYLSNIGSAKPESDSILIKDIDQFLEDAIIYRDSDKKKYLNLLNQAFDICKKENNRVGTAKVYNALAYQYSNTGQRDSSLSFSLKALKIADKIQDSSIKSNAYLNLGIVYYGLGNNEISKKYSKLAIQFGDKFIKASATANIGMLYDSTNTDSAFYCFETANKIFLTLDKTNQRVLSNIAITYMNMGTIALEKKEFSKAKLYFNKSLSLSYKIDNFDNIVLNYLNFGDVFKDEKNYPLSEQMFLRAKCIADSVNLNDLFNLSTYALSDLYYEQKDYKKSRDFLEQYINQRDSIQVVDIENKIANLQMNYEVQKQKDHIKILEKEQKLNSYRIFITALLILFLASIVIYYLNKRRLKVRRRMALAVENRNKTQEKLEKAKNDIIHYTKLIQENNERIECFEQELLNSSSKNNEELTRKQEKLRGMKILKDEDWVHYKVLFKDVYTNFYTKVSNIPGLTEGDKRQILLIKLDYTNKMSADVLGISVEGIKRAKQRLAKKLELKNAGELEEYFQKL